MKAVVLLICLFLAEYQTDVVGHGFPKLTGPLMARDGQGATLTCEVEMLNKSIAWMYNDATYFTCDYPYKAGMCVTDKSYSFRTNVKENTFRVTFSSEVNVNDGNWTCQHGNDTSHPVAIDIGESPAAPTVTASNTSPSGGDNVTFTCEAQETTNERYKPTRFRIYADDGTNKVDVLDVTDPTNLMYSTTIMFGCKFVEYHCCVYNTYGFNCSAYGRVRPADNCPVEIKKDLTMTNVTAQEGDEFIEIGLAYNGIPRPQYEWYRLEDGTEMNLTTYRISHRTRYNCSPHGSACVILLIGYPIEADSGYYVVHVNASGLIDSHTFHLNVMPPSAVSTTVVPSTATLGPSSDDLTFGQGIGIGIAIGLGVVLFTVGGIYGCRKA